jgi:hypothetical protein
MLSRAKVHLPLARRCVLTTVHRYATLARAISRSLPWLESTTSFKLCIAWHMPSSIITNASVAGPKGVHRRPNDVWMMVANEVRPIPHRRGLTCVCVCCNEVGIGSTLSAAVQHKRAGNHSLNLAARFSRLACLLEGLTPRRRRCRTVALRAPLLLSPCRSPVNPRCRTCRRTRRHRRCLPVEGPKPHACRYPNPLSPLLPEGAETSRFMCCHPPPNRRLPQGAETLRRRTCLEGPKPHRRRTVVLPARGPKPCTRQLPVG